MGHLDKPSTLPTEIFVIGGNAILFLRVLVSFKSYCCRKKKDTTHLSLGLIL